MTWNNVRLIFAREVRDQFRDRRTLFMVAVLPILLYPALGIGMLQMMVLFKEQPRTVVLLGADELSDEPRLLHGGRIAANWFEAPQDGETLRVITDKPPDTGIGEGGEKEDRAGHPVESNEDRRAVLDAARRIREQLPLVQQWRDQLDRTADPAQAGPLESRLDALNDRLSRLFQDYGIDVLIIVPEGFHETVGAVREATRTGNAAALADRSHEQIQVVRNPADEKSLAAWNRVSDALDAWAARFSEMQLEQAGLPKVVVSPVSEQPVDIARDEQLSATVWSKIFPALLVMMALTGAFYPATDLAAGEKERGTMETLLICPARRGEIVLGKFFTVLCFSVSTAILNLASMGLTARYMASASGGGTLERLGNLQAPSLASLAWVLLLLVPLAALFSALCLSLATFARSSKEGQYYLTPLLMVTMGITVFCVSPGVQIDPFKSVVPVMGPALLLRELLAAPGDPQPFFFVVPVLLTSVGYSLLALWWAKEQFTREEVLFREAERFDLRLWMRHLLRDKEPTPTFGMAGFCFVLIMLLQFGSLKFFQDAHLAGMSPVRVLIIQQLALIGCPALLMGAFLTSNVRRTFRLRMPSPSMLAVAVALPVVLYPPVVETISFLVQIEWLPDYPEAFKRALEQLGGGAVPMWQALLAMAIVPAVCEELAFRGFILSGFGRSQKHGLAIVLSSIAFGVVHIFPLQMVYATLLGIVLGLLAVRSGSLWPAVLFHVNFNGMNVVRSHVARDAWDDGPLRWLVYIAGDELHYRWTTLAVCTLVSGGLLWWLLRQRTRPDGDRVDDRLAATVKPLPSALGEESHAGVP